MPDQCAFLVISKAPLLKTQFCFEFKITQNDEVSANVLAVHQRKFTQHIFEHHNSFIVLAIRQNPWGSQGHRGLDGNSPWQFEVHAAELSTGEYYRFFCFLRQICNPARASCDRFLVGQNDFLFPTRCLC